VLWNHSSKSSSQVLLPEGDGPFLSYFLLVDKPNIAMVKAEVRLGYEEVTQQEMREIDRTVLGSSNTKVKETIVR
jgi:hypothetical protein